MSHNVRIDALLRAEACQTQHFTSVYDARLQLPALDMRHFSPRMQFSVTEARFSTRVAQLKRSYVMHPVVPLGESTSAASGGSARTPGKKKLARKPEPVAPDAVICERESGIMVISARQLALLENRVYRGEYYAFLMTHSLQGKKTDTHIGYSTNPIMEIHRHNTLRIDRTTKTAAPHWRADIFLGPVHCLAKVIALCRDWVDGTRGKESKRKRATLLARVYNVDIYSCQVPAPPLGRYLAQYAPRAYQEAHKKLRLHRSAESREI